MSGSGNDVESPTNFNDCVSKAELQKFADDQRTFMIEKFDEMMSHINNLITRVEHVEQRPPPAHEDDDRDADRLHHNRYGMGGNYNRGNNDPYAKAKFTMILFTGTADPEKYLNRNLLLNKNLILI
jgi:hypothetical protein